MAIIGFKSMADSIEGDFPKIFDDFRKNVNARMAYANSRALSMFDISPTIVNNQLKLQKKIEYYTKSNAEIINRKSSLYSEDFLT